MIKAIYDFAPYAAALKWRYYKTLEVSRHSEDLSLILREHPQLLIACNHGSVLGVLAGVCGFCELLMKHGGADRKPLIIAWRYFYQVPYLRRGVAYVTQTDNALSAEELQAAFQQEAFTDLMVMPEGDNSLLGDGQTVQPFVSPRFIELALKLGLPVLIVAHYGTASLAREIKVSRKRLRYLPLLTHFMSDNSQQRLLDSGGVNLPKPFSGRCQKLSFSFKVYQPDFTQDQLEALGVDEKRELLQQESDKVQALMQEMIDEMG